MTASAQPIDFVALMPTVAAKLLGKPSSATKTELRYGTHGSLSIDLRDGQFYHHEDKKGGGVLDLIVRERGGQVRDALEWLEREGLKQPTEPAETAEQQINALRQKMVAKPVVRTFYDYTDADGVVLYRVERREENGSKTFRQHGPDGKGGFRCASGCMDGVRRVPYLLHSLAAATPTQIVFIVEGEKDADRLAALGLVATTNSQGAGKFGAELTSYFEGRTVVIIPDNDETGRNHAEDVAGKLNDVAAAVAILALPGLPEKEDVSWWLAAGGSPDELARLAKDALATPESPPETFELADLSLWSRTLPTPKAFLMAPFIPRDDVVIITGDGGTNKSTLALQISVAAAAGKQMLGMDVAPGPALYVTAEDDNRENHWRLSKIADALDTTIDALDGRLHLASLRGRLNNELATFDHDGKLRPAEAYKLLRATIEKTGAKLVTLDNVAHLFAGSENDRSQVTAFINLLYQLCGDFGVTILLIAHRNKNGDTYSGSTAWLNAVRSQVLIERVDESDADLRRLSLGKANYARQGEDIEFRWHDFALIRGQDLPVNTMAELGATVAANAENEAFINCLRARDSQGEGRQVGPSPGPNYAPAQFEGMAEAKRFKRLQLKKAMDRLFTIGAIETYTYRNAAKARDVTVIREVPRSSRTPTPNASRTDPERTPNPRLSASLTTPHTHSISKDISGAASRAAAPPLDNEVEFPPEPAAPPKARAGEERPRVVFPALATLPHATPSRVVFPPLPVDQRDEFAPWPEDDQ